MNDTTLPITGICLISKPNNVPTGYYCIRKTFDDTNRDADLMPDSLLERKDRFLCITRAWPLTDMRVLGGERAVVLEDVKLIGERDAPPPGYTTLSYTTDTREKGTAKKLICVKMTDRQAGMKCICDIAFLYRTKRPPQYYTLIGDINGLQMCVKEGNVPPMRGAPTIPSATSNLYPNPTTGQSFLPPQAQSQSQLPYPPSDYSTLNPTAKKTDEKEILDGIPFEINPKYLQAMRNPRSGNDLDGLESFRILSSRDIEQYFHYDFHVERAAL